MIKAKEDDLKKFGPSKIVLKAYSGKPGCACGLSWEVLLPKSNSRTGNQRSWL